MVRAMIVPASPRIAIFKQTFSLKTACENLTSDTATRSNLQRASASGSKPSATLQFQIVQHASLHQDQDRAPTSLHNVGCLPRFAVAGPKLRDRYHSEIVDARFRRYR